MSSTALSEARIRALKPRDSAYDVRDAKLRSFGVRVLPSGARRFFIHAQHRGERFWKIVGDANTMRLDEARARAISTLGAIRRGENASDRPADTRFEGVAGMVFERYARVWKPRTLEVNRTYLRRQLLPWFAGRDIADINRQDVQRWFASLRVTPAAADRSAPVLSVIMREGRASRVSSRRVQSVPGAPALPPQGSRTVSLRGGASPAGVLAFGARG